MVNQRLRSVVIAGGGTGGHIYPGLAIAEGLHECGIDKKEIVFIGSRGRIESTLVPQAGYHLVELPGRGLNHSEFLRNIVNVVLLVCACIKVFFLFIARRPRVVIGVGGYASAPALVAAWILRINRVFHEQNSVVGRTNRLAQKLGATALLTFQETSGAHENAIVAGMPLRGDMGDVKKIREEYLKNDHAPTVLVTGGSMGSAAINTCVYEMVVKFYRDINFSVVHVTGKYNYETLLEEYDKIDTDNKVTLYNYRDDLPMGIAQSDCVIARAGASTCVELEILGARSVLIPLPSAPGDHQRHNAQNLVDAGLCTLLDQDKCDAQILYKEVSNALAQAASGPRNSYHEDARRTIAEYLFDKYLAVGSQ